MVVKGQQRRRCLPLRWVALALVLAYSAARLRSVGRAGLLQLGFCASQLLRRPQPADERVGAPAASSGLGAVAAASSGRQSFVSGRRGLRRGVVGQGRERPQASAGSVTQQQEAPAAVSTASLPTMVINLFKNIVGATVLSLAAGTAAFSDLPTAVVPASVLTLAVAAVCTYSFCMIARGCELTGSQTFREAWVKARGEESAWLISVAFALMAGAGCLQYLVVLTDAGTSLAAAAGAPALLASRPAVLLGIAGFLLLPLSFLESCKQLQYTSVFGIAGVVYYIAAIAFRFFQGSYAPGGAYHRLIEPAMRPSFGATGGSFFSPKALVLVSMLTTAYVCHYNAPKFYRELENRSIPRFTLLAVLGFGMSGLLYVVGLCSSFLTFGGHSAGFIFNNYAPNDGLFIIARVIVSFVMLCTYPLLIVAFRDGAMELVPKRNEKPLLGKRAMTVALVALLALFGLLIKDVGVIVSVPGAIFGSAIVYIFPSLVFLRVTRSRQGGRLQRLERLWCRGLLVIGVLFAGLGTGSSLGLLGA